MMKMRPVSDLKDKFCETVSVVQNGTTVCLTQNGRGSAVLLSHADSERLANPVAAALDVADRLAEETTMRLTHEEFFRRIRARK